MAWLYLTLVAIWGGLTAITWWPPKGKQNFVGFAIGWLYGELPLHHIAVQLIVTLGFLSLGGLDSALGRIALALAVGNWVALLAHWRTSYHIPPRAEAALREAFGPRYLDRIDPELRTQARSGLEWSRILWPFSPRSGRAVRRHVNVRFARLDEIDLCLDVYTPAGTSTGRPVLFQIHGGAWVVGTKNEQALPLMYHMAERGWVCVSTSYRLSPKATFPDHVADCKRALAWVKQHIKDYGGDPSFVIATGGSAGGHLASLVALTPNAPEYQPGFESEDTTVQGCVPFYGVFDWTSRTPRPQHAALEGVLERSVMKRKRSEAPDAYRLASPMWRVSKSAPPFLILHGGSDALVPVEDARDFAELLQKESEAPVAYLEIPRAQHAFDIFESVRTQYAVNATEVFCSLVYSDYLIHREGARG